MLSVQGRGREVIKIQINCLDLAISQCIYITITSSSMLFIVCICQLKIQRKNDYYSMLNIKLLMQTKVNFTSPVAKALSLKIPT